MVKKLPCQETFVVVPSRRIRREETRPLRSSILRTVNESSLNFRDTYSTPSLFATRRSFATEQSSPWIINSTTRVERIGSIFRWPSQIFHEIVANFTPPSLAAAIRAHPLRAKFRPFRFWRVQEGGRRSRGRGWNQRPFYRCKLTLRGRVSYSSDRFPGISVADLLPQVFSNGCQEDRSTTTAAICFSILRTRLGRQQGCLYPVIALLGIIF